MRARKRLGQNWLVDRGIARRLVDAVGAGPSDLVVEIGPGPGALTDLLAQTAGHVLAIELDPRMREPLESRIGPDRLTIVEADVLDLDLTDLIRSTLGRHRGLERAHVAANLPYYISSPVVAHLIAHRAAIADAVLMLQREVVDRLTATPGGKEYGALTVLARMYSDPCRLFDVPPGAFRPVPKVTSSVVRLTMRSEPAVPVGDEKLFFRIVRGAFAQRRKTLENNLAAIGLAGVAAEAGIDPRRRAETLDLDEFAALASVASARRNS